jgi:hypothetical protein
MSGAARLGGEVQIGLDTQGVPGAGAGVAGAGAGVGGSGGKAKAAPANDKLFIVSVELKAPGGVALAYEQVVLVKAGTTEVVVGPIMTDADGRFAVAAPEPIVYDVQILDDGADHHEVPPPKDVNAVHLLCQFFVNGAPAAGELVTICGDDLLQAAAILGEHGELELAVAPGAYEITARRQTFRAHTLCIADLDQADGHHQFVIENEIDWALHERAREHRFSPAERGPGDGQGEE